MDARQLNKALNVISNESIEIDEAPYLCGGDRMVRDAKRASKRAQRRAGVAMVALGLAEYEAEVEHEAMEEAALIAEDMAEVLLQENALQQEEIEEECQENRLVLHYLPETTGFFGDCNHPGVVYWTPGDRLEAAKEALRVEGGSPFDISRAGAFWWSTKPDHEMMDGFPWALRQWRNF